MGSENMSPGEPGYGSNEPERLSRNKVELVPALSVPAPRVEVVEDNLGTERNQRIKTIESRLSSRIDAERSSPDLLNWRHPLLVGGTRLLAQEMVLKEALLGPRPSESMTYSGNIKNETDSGSVKSEAESKIGAIIERFRLAVEILGMAIGRLLMLRAAGLRARQQRHLAGSIGGYTGQ